MICRVLHGDTVIGTAHLDELDDGMGTASGRFTSAPGYEDVRAVFQLFVAAQARSGPAARDLLDEYYRRRDALALSVLSENGNELPVSVVHIEDYADELGADAVHIELHFGDRSVLSTL